MTMPPRRTHKKSRNGCDQCKNRRVKCDEGGPPCANCVTRGLECHYTRPALFRELQLTELSGSQPRSLSPIKSQPESAVSVEDPPRETADVEQAHNTSDVNANPYSWPLSRQRELELMHQWCTKTSYSFSHEFSDVFQGHVVKEALKHGYLMDSILALASLHIASEMTDSASASLYASEALQYQNHAVPAFRTALQNVTPSNCDAIFASAVLTMACTVVSPFIPIREEDSPKLANESITLLFDCLKGIHSIIDISRQWLISGPFQTMVMIRDEEIFPGNDRLVPPLQHLQDVNSTSSIMANSTHHEVYKRLIGQLGSCFVKDKNMAIPWLFKAGEELMNALCEGEPMAVVIFMFWGVLLDQLDDLWWAKYSGKRLVQEMSSRIHGHGKEWDQAVSWAKSQVGL